MAQVVRTSKELDWIHSKAQPMIDFDGQTSDGALEFRGALPARMVSALRDFLRDNPDYCYRDTGREAVYNTSGDTFSLAISFGVRLSTQNHVHYVYHDYSAEIARQEAALS